MSVFTFKRRAILLSFGAISLFGLVAAACGGDPSNDEIVDRLVDEGLSEDQATCMVDELGDDAGRLFGADEDEISDEDAEKLFGAVFSCIEV
ncbi:MAG: hypothetical protein WD557_13705 [Dehalococcoidia bacterium]